MLFFDPLDLWEGGAAVVGGTPPTVSIDQGASATIYEGSARQLSATLGGSPTPDLAWESDNELVATVDAAGLVTGVALGTATITATATSTEGSASDTIDVEVVEVVVGTGAGRRVPLLHPGPLGLVSSVRSRLR